MRTGKLPLALPLALALALGACAAPAAAPDAADTATDAATEEGAEMAEAVAVLPDEPYEAVEAQLFPGPEGAYVGDVMPFVADDGTLELYYLYDTSHNGQGYHPIYKFSTSDLSGWTDHGMMLDNGLGSDPDPALGTGCVMQDKDGLYRLFYTGHNDSGNNGRGKECVMQATSTDRENWTKQPEPLFFAPEGYDKDDFRDPEVFWVEEENCYWLLIAARNETLEGCVLKYTSTDLNNWEFVGPIFAPLNEYMCECPSVMRIGDKYYLTYSWDCVTYYAVSDSINGPYVPPRDNILDGQGLTSGAGFNFYAAKSAEKDGHYYLCGWLGQAGLSSDSGVYQWAGTVLVHEIFQNADGSLGVKAPEVLSEYFTVDKPVEIAPVCGEVTVEGTSATLTGEGDLYAVADMGTRPASMTLECDVTMSEDACVGFAFGGSGSDTSWTGLALDARRNCLHFEGYRLEDLDYLEPGDITRFDFDRTNTHHVKLVCENDVVIMYVDGLKVLSSRISHSTGGQHIGLFADGGTATFENVTMTLPA